MKVSTRFDIKPNYVCLDGFVNINVFIHDWVRIGASFVDFFNRLHFYKVWVLIFE